MLARENAGRAPRRTSATAAALMIGVALVSAAAVFASSLRATFTERPRAQRARPTTSSPTSRSRGCRRRSPRRCSRCPSSSAVTAVRGAAALVDGDAEGDRRRRPAGVRAARRHRRPGGQLPGPGRRRHLRPQGPGRRTSTSQVGDTGRADVPERHRADAAGGRHLRRRLDRRQLADLARHARAGAARRRRRATSSSSPSSPRASRPEQGDAAVEAAMAPFPQAKVRDQRRVPQVPGGPDQPAARRSSPCCWRSRSSSPCSASRSRWPSACSSGRGRSA